MPEKYRLICRNTCKALLLLTSGVIIFELIITIFPFIGSFFLTDFPLWRVIKENFALFVPLSIFCILLAPVLGVSAAIYRHKRILRLLITGIIGYWFAVLFVLLIFSNFTLINENLFNVLLLTIWGFLAYSIFSLPILIPAILLFEKWTRPESEIKI